MVGLKERYSRDTVPALMSEFGYRNVMEVPRLMKVVVNIGIGEAVTNAKALESAQSDLAAITGQHPITTRSKRSISAFKLREGMPVGLKSTLRGRRMEEFLDKLINVVLPRIRDFHGVSPDSFDGSGNYTLGFKEQVTFPEIDFDKVDKLRGLEVSIVTSARTDQEGRRLLELLGMPFSRS